LSLLFLNDTNVCLSFTIGQPHWRSTMRGRRRAFIICINLSILFLASWSSWLRSVTVTTTWCPPWLRESSSTRRSLALTRLSAATSSTSSTASTPIASLSACSSTSTVSLKHRLVYMDPQHTTVPVASSCLGTDPSVSVQLSCLVTTPTLPTPNTSAALIPPAVWLKSWVVSLKSSVSMDSVGNALLSMGWTFLGLHWNQLSFITPATLESDTDQFKFVCTSRRVYTMTV